MPARQGNLVGPAWGPQSGMSNVWAVQKATTRQKGCAVVMKVAVLTGGGDCPGLNAVIRALVRKAPHLGFEVMGCLDGWQGIIVYRHILLTSDDTRGPCIRGCTYL